MSDRQSILSTPSPLIDDDLANTLFNNAFEFDIESINFESTDDLSVSTTMDYSSMITRPDYQPCTLGPHNVARLSILPIYPYFTLSSTGRLITKSSNTPQLLLSNVPSQSLSDKQYNNIRCYRFPTLFNLKINSENNQISSCNYSSFMIYFYQNLYMKIRKRLKVQIPILDFNLIRLQYCIDKVVTQRGLQEKMLNLEELSIALEFYLQIDVDMFFLKTCSFNGVQPRLINNRYYEGLFCHDIPSPRFALMPCNKPHCLCCHSPCPRRYVTNLQQTLIIPFSIPHIHQFVNQYKTILNCPATCETSNCIYVLTCPCGQFDFIGISKLSFAETLAIHREESNRIIREFLIGESNIDRITHGLKSDQKKANDKLWLYQHSPRCSVALQLFLDYNPDYWCFVPMKKLDIHLAHYSISSHSSTTVSTAAESSFSLPSILRSSTAWNRSNEQIHTLIQNIPKPPLAFDFSPHQRQQQIHFFKLLHDRIVPLNNVDVYNANIITVLPDKCSQLFQYLIESLLITHAECKLNNIGHLVNENVYDNSDPIRTLHNSWCANLTRRPLP